ncbi:MoxR family ATPase [Leptospira levettii]|uniref:AAA family ATPase n=1 Tax=Leptospira levettii TaxID=2023178 RepID=A0A6H3NQZ6_9LEPT|nr:MoxR family ATPase [Leptospira levettii]PKA28174.1 ATPase [Leptospira sp. mixed culture ATI2-C-A1]MCW7467364.1 AAA family ATPase [Leptospira levettii]MCW7498044.1 AAA family ATPase [Leptospira levettii]MCW7513086.1 AAA family ATPase [Leptospira levettii]MCW7516780.1 AAA family ATPase [Leptospira levettii]
MQIDKEQIKEISDQMKLIRSELAESISGMDEVIQSLFVALVANGHILLEGMPGLAKTLVAKNLASIIDAKFSRVQFTPDLLPADLIGTNIFNPKSSSFEIRKGPIFTNVLLADEINRAPAKVQSALLQCMEERQVSIADQTFDLTPPFFVIATQNPIDQEGTYPLPEAQLDRFLFKVNVAYPSFEDEVSILHQHGNVNFEKRSLKKVMKPKEIQRISEISNHVFVDPKLFAYIVQLTRNTRPESTSDKDLKIFLSHGVSPRASIALLKVSRINALLEGRTFVIPEDIQRYFPEIVKHRLHLTIDAISEDVSTTSIIKRILTVTEVP